MHGMCLRRLLTRRCRDGSVARCTARSFGGSGHSLPSRPSRHYASHSTMEVFDKRMKLAQRDAAALTASDLQYEYLRDEVARRVIDRLSDITRTFPHAVDVGCNTANIARQLPVGQSGIQTLLSLDTSFHSLRRARRLMAEAPSKGVRHHFALYDEEFLPLPPDTFDLVLSSMHLHWVNDIPALLSQALAALKPDSPFIVAMLGGSTLQELRSAFSLTDRERTDSLTPHVSPFVTPRDIGDLLSAAGFALPTVDADTVTVRYPDAFTLFHHLHAMAEQGAGLMARRGGGGRDALMGAAAVYESMYRDDDGLLPCTFQVFYGIGWKPHKSQQQPKRRGSATRRLSDLDKLLQEKERGGGTANQQVPSATTGNSSSGGKTDATEVKGDTTSDEKI